MNVTVRNRLQSAIICLMGTVSISCASAPTPPESTTLNSSSSPWASSYLGRKGYFSRPLVFVGGEGTEFQRCQISEIMEIKTDCYSNCTNEDIFNGTKGFIRVVIKQGDKLFDPARVSGENGVFVVEGGKIKALDSYLVPALKIPSKSVKFKEGNKSVRDLLCSNTIWTGMTEDEFLFIKKEPSEINRTTMRGLDLHQWVYRSGDYKAEYYYFKNGKLTSWQD